MRRRRMRRKMLPGGITEETCAGKKGGKRCILQPGKQGASVPKPAPVTPVWSRSRFPVCPQECLWHAGICSRAGQVLGLALSLLLPGPGSCPAPGQSCREMQSN